MFKKCVFTNGQKSHNIQRSKCPSVKCGCKLDNQIHTYLAFRDFSRSVGLLSQAFYFSWLGCLTD